MRGLIYGLYDPRTGELCYIGKANDLQARLKSHILDSRRQNRPVCCWVRELATIGMTPEIRVLEDADDWREAERRLIALHRITHKLLNVADGGDEPHCSLETRRKNGYALAAELRNNPRKMLFRKLFIRGGSVIKEYERIGKTEKAAKLTAVMAKLKALEKSDPPQLFARLVARNFEGAAFL